VFTSTVSASKSSRSLDLAAVSAPLICSSWNAPGTEALYERITLYTEAQCILLKRTLQDVPSLLDLIQFLRLPSPREGSILFLYKPTDCRGTPASVVTISADILAACRHVQEVDVLQHASKSTSRNPSSTTNQPFYRMIPFSTRSTHHTSVLFVLVTLPHNSIPPIFARQFDSMLFKNLL
jgi:hypothetical protein